MRKEEIINRIEKNSDNYYRIIAKEYLKSYSKLDDFEKNILSEVICRMIEKSYSIEECFSEISEEYNINCEKIVSFAIIPSIKMPGIKSKILFWTNIKPAIYQCVNIMKMEVVKIAFKHK